MDDFRLNDTAVKYDGSTFSTGVQYINSPENSSPSYIQNAFHMAYHATSSSQEVSPTSLVDCSPYAVISESRQFNRPMYYRLVRGSLFINDTIHPLIDGGLTFPSAATITNNYFAVTNEGDGPVHNVVCSIMENSTTWIVNDYGLLSCDAPSSTCQFLPAAGPSLTFNVDVLLPGETMRMIFAENAITLVTSAFQTPGVSMLEWTLVCTGNQTSSDDATITTNTTISTRIIIVGRYPENSLCCSTANVPAGAGVGDRFSFTHIINFQPGISENITLSLSLPPSEASLISLFTIFPSNPPPTVILGSFIVDTVANSITFPTVVAVALSPVNVTFEIEIRSPSQPSTGTFILSRNEGIVIDSFTSTPFYSISGDCSIYPPDLCGICVPVTSPFFNTCVGGCDDRPNSTLTLDSCGFCRATDRDECTSATCPSGQVQDHCGICRNSTSTKFDICLGCDDTPFSDRYFSWCGECVDQYDPNPCPGRYCDGSYDSGYQVDACGNCLNPQSADFQSDASACPLPLADDLVPVIICWSQGTGTDQFVAFASYRNDGAEVNVPVGAQNTFALVADRNQPTYFASGDGPSYGEPGVFLFKWDGRREEWRLGQKVRELSFFLSFSHLLIRLSRLIFSMTALHSNNIDALTVPFSLSLPLSRAVYPHSQYSRSRWMSSHIL